MIEAGRVRVNGETVRRLPVFVDPERDDIVVDGRPIPRHSRKVYVMLHKPERTLVSAADEPDMGRRTVLDLVDHPGAARLFPVGRLDFDTTGLVLLTNDGELANRLTHPRYGVTKTYEVTVKGLLDDGAIEAIRTKANLASRREDEEHSSETRGATAPGIVIVKREPGRTVLEVTLQEARNRQLREILKVLGMPVKKMARVAVGPLELKGVAMGEWRELTRPEIQLLRAAAKGRITTRQTPKKQGKPTGPGGRRPRPARPSARRPR